MKLRTVRSAIVFSALLILGSLPGPAMSALQVVAVQGEVLAGGRQIQPGASLAAGIELRTGADGQVRFSLADGSSLTLQAAGQLVIDQHRELGKGKGTDTTLRLERGRLEASIRGPQQGSTRFEVRTPVAVATTRGALFRVTADPARRSTTLETVEGSVLVADTANAGSVSVTGGSGTRVLAGSPPIRPRTLLTGPHLWTGIQLVEHKRIEIPFSPLAGAIMYRVIVTPGEDLARHLVEEIVAAPRLRIEGLADGDYFVRVRAIDQLALEGSETIARMRVRVRADPPELVQPPDRGRLDGNAAELAWLPDQDAIGYVAQLAEDNAFRDRQREWTGLREPKLSVAGLRPGIYHWRVASMLKDGSQSRFSTARTFRLDPPLLPPVPPRLEGDRLHFTWTGRPGQIFLLQLAADPRFQLLVEERHGSQPEVSLTRPMQGTYFARLRATDPDGWVGPFSEAIRIEIAGPAARTPCLVPGERGVCAVYAPLPPSR